MSEAKIRLTAEDQTKAAIQSAMRNLSSLSDTAAAVTARLGTIGVAIAGAFTAATLKGVIDTLDNLDDLSEKSGIAVKSLSALRYAGEVTGTPFESLANSTRFLAKSMAEAAGGNKEAEATFKALGVTVKNQDGSLRAQDDVLRDLADRFSGYEDGAGKAALAQQVFGKSGAEMIPLLNQGSAGIRALTEEAEALGAVYGGDLARDAAAFNDNLKKLEINAEAAKVALAGQLLPTLNNLLQLALQLAQVKGGVWGWLTGPEGGSDLGRAGQMIGEIEQKLENVRKMRKEIEGSTANNGFLRYLPGFGTVGELHTLDVQEKKLTERLEFFRSLDAVQRRSVNAEAARLENEYYGGGGKKPAPVVKHDDGSAERARAKALADAARAEKELADARAKAAEQHVKYLAGIEAENEAILRRNTSLSDEIEEVGLTAAAVDQLRIKRLESNLERERENLLAAQNIEGNQAEVAQVERRIRLMQQEVGLQRQLAGRKVAVDEQKKADDAAADYSKTLHDDLKGAFQRAFEDSENPAKAFAKALASTIYSRVSAALADSIANSLLGQGGGAGGAGAGGAGTLRGILGALGGLFGGSSFGVGSAYMDGPFMHSGGIAGAEATFTRPVPASVFYGAPRFHTGGIAGDEVPAILRRGEGVFTPKQMQALGKDHAGTGLTIVNNLTVGDVASMHQVQEQLRQSERRIFATLRRAATHGK